MAHTINPSKLAPDGGVTKAPSPSGRSRTSLIVPIGTAITPALFNTAARESIQHQPYDVNDKVLSLVCGQQDTLRPKRGSPQERCFFSMKHPEYVAYNLRTALDQEVQQNALNRSASRGVGDEIVFTAKVNAEESEQKDMQTPCKTDVEYRTSKAAFVGLTIPTLATAAASDPGIKFQEEFELGYAAYEAGDYQSAFNHFNPIKQDCLVAAYLVALMLYDRKVETGEKDIPIEQQAIDLMFDIYVRASMNDAYANDNSIGIKEIKHAACYLLGIAHETGVGNNQSIIARNDDCAMKWWRDAACDLVHIPRHHEENANSSKTSHQHGEKHYNSNESRHPNDKENSSSADQHPRHMTVADKLAEDDMYQTPIITDFGVLCQVKLAKYYHAHDDEKSATFWFRQAARNGHLESQATLGMILYLQNDKKDQQKQAEALKILKEAAESGSLNGSAMLAAIYFDKRMFDMCVRWAIGAVNFAFEICGNKKQSEQDQTNSWQTLAFKCDSTVTSLKNCVASSLCYYSFCLRHGLGGASGVNKNSIVSKEVVDKADECAKLAMQLDSAQTKRIMQFVH